MDQKNIFNFGQSKIFVTMFMMVLLMACSDSGSKPKVCDAPVDTVSIINELKVDTAVYYLVHRVTGWHDKSEIIELYDRKPTFNNCAKSDIEPVFGDSLDLDSTVSHIYLNLKTKQLNIKYVAGKPGASHNTSLKLELEAE